MFRTTLLSILWSLLTCVHAQDSISCPCCTPQHQQFSFWLGDWNVFDTTGAQVGTNLLISMQNGCVLQENWESAGGGTGTSYNYYDQRDSTWNQVWIDNNGSPLVLKGGLKNGSMVLHSDLIQGQHVPFYRNRVTWTPQKDGSVLQVWDILNEDGKILQNAFRGIYRKKPDR